MVGSSYRLRSRVVTPLDPDQYRPRKVAKSDSPPSSSKIKPDPPAKVDADANAKVPSSSSFKIKLSDGNTSYNENEAILQKFATIALDRLNRNKRSYKLVEAAGPLGKGHTEGRRLFHFNLKAKNVISDDPVEETFFCELVEDARNDGFVCNAVILLGPSVSLPDKADTFGCVYCDSLQIHHHGFTLPYHIGRDEHFQFLRSEVKNIREYFAKCESENREPCYPNPGVVNRGKKFNRSEPKPEEVALSIYNKNKNTKFKLVKTGCTGGASTGIGIVQHMSFFAKEDAPKAPLHTFFAEAIISSSFFFVDFCECLGRSRDLPAIADIRGCCYCSDCKHFHHPPGPGYINGR